MASITKLPSGAYRVQIRRKGRYASETFLRRDDAHRWARQAETRVDQGLAPNKSSVSRLQIFGDLIDLHIADMFEVGKPPRRSKAATLTTLKRDLGKENIGHLDRQKLIDYGKMRAEQGAGRVTLGIDIRVIKMIITHAAAVHGLDISPEPVDLARVALKRLGLIGKGTERDRRPIADELNRLFLCFEDNERLTTPMTRIVKFAVATANPDHARQEQVWEALQRHYSRQAARFLGLSGRTLDKHRTYGTGPRYSKIGGRVVYAVDDLQAWVTRGEKTSDETENRVLPAKRHAAVSPAHLRRGR